MKKTLPEKCQFSVLKWKIGRNFEENKSCRKSHRFHFWHFFGFLDFLENIPWKNGSAVFRNRKFLVKTEIGLCYRNFVLWPKIKKKRPNSRFFVVNCAIKWVCSEILNNICWLLLLHMNSAEPGFVKSYFCIWVSSGR